MTHHQPSSIVEPIGGVLRFHRYERSAAEILCHHHTSDLLRDERSFTARK